MNRSLRLSIAVLLICILTALSSRPARAQIGISNGQAAAITVAMGAIAVGVGVGLYFAFRTPPTITGCAIAGTNGLTLQSEGDHQTFFLTGETAPIKAGDRVKVKGKKQKKDAAGNRSFLVSDLKNDYGACTNLAPIPLTSPRR
jgi:hypothetical protein